jgi:rhamnosyl/mannosyltransferase
MYGSGIDWVNQNAVTGLTVEPCRPEALAQALNHILGNPETARTYGTNARQRYEELFTAQRMADQVRAMYLSLRL